MQEPRAFCRALMHEYERQWSRATGHGVRHPLRVKMQTLQAWCDETCAPAEFEARLVKGAQSEDPREALLVGELLPLWRTVASGGRLPFPT
ncbi:MAG: hypothetical protein M3069_15485 [Chloroflexota bacterium]|nr:hypothetical protein [Chloroflexota bacterium]